jgi:hypothetical protein
MRASRIFVISLLSGFIFATSGFTADVVTEDESCDQCVEGVDIINARDALGNGKWQALALSLQQQVLDLEARIAELESNSVLALDGYLSLNSDDVSRPTALFAGVNLQVIHGAGPEALEPNGLGNVIVGYDLPFVPREGDTEVCSWGEYRTQEECEMAGQIWAMQHKSGSHNLVIGEGHRYSWMYGVVAGGNDTINNDSSSIIGGHYGVAEGRRAVILGGSSHVAGGNNAAVLGGWGNSATGIASTISGGVHNTATVQGATVTGGNWNVADGFNSTVSGGSHNTAAGPQSSVCGGWLNSAIGKGASVSGGYNNVATGDYSSVSGGNAREAVGEYDWVAGSLMEDE